MNTFTSEVYAASFLLRILLSRLHFRQLSIAAPRRTRATSGELRKEKETDKQQLSWQIRVQALGNLGLLEQGSEARRKNEWSL